MAQAHPYHQFFNSLAAKDINVSSDTFKFALLKNTYVPNLATHQFFSSVSSFELPSGNGYTTGGAVISSFATGLISTNCVQTITPPGSGTYIITLTIGTNTQSTGAIAHDATATTLLAAIQALPNVGSIPSSGTSNVAVTGSGPYTVTFQNALGAQVVGLMSVSAGSVAMTTPGQGTWSLTGGNVSWTSATFLSPNAAHFGVVYDSTPGSAATDPLVGLVDFVTDETPSNGTLSATWDPTGIVVVQVS